MIIACSLVRSRGPIVQDPKHARKVSSLEDDIQSLWEEEGISSPICVQRGYVFRETIAH